MDNLLFWGISFLNFNLVLDVLHMYLFILLIKQNTLDQYLLKHKLTLLFPFIIRSCIFNHTDSMKQKVLNWKIYGKFKRKTWNGYKCKRRSKLDIYLKINIIEVESFFYSQELNYSEKIDCTLSYISLNQITFFRIELLELVDEKNFDNFKKDKITKIMKKCPNLKTLELTEVKHYTRRDGIRALKDHNSLS